MAATFKPLEYYTTKLYERGKSTKRFLEISEEDLAKLAKRVYKKQEAMTERHPLRNKRANGLERYNSTLEYLTNPLVHLDFKSFDEKIAFLIMMVDPELVIYKEYLKANIMSTSDIANVEDEKERAALVAKRNEAIIDYQTKVRDIVGFYDSKLLKYEEMYFNKFFCDKELVTDVNNSSNQNFFMLKSKLLKNFDNISDERFEELKNIAQACLSLTDDKYTLGSAVFNVNNQKKLLGLKNLAEQVTLFILLVDSELDMLKIYEEESRMKNVEDRITEQFGYFDVQLLILEKLFHSRFCPDKELSIWSK